MKCPVCQAKLLPVDGEMFCLQCGTAVAPEAGQDMKGPAIEETTDPLLQKAIVDSLQHDVAFRLPVSAAPPVQKASSFATMRQFLAPARPGLSGGAAVMAAPATMPEAEARGKDVAAKGPVPVMKAPVEAAPAVVKVAAAVAVSGVKPVDRPSISKPVLASEAIAAAPKRGAVSLNLLPVPAKAQSRAAGFSGWHRPSLAWVAGVGVFAAFLAVNLGLSAYYSQRVYPGVRVAGVNVGGVPLSVLHQKLMSSLAEPTLVAQVGVANYALDTKDMGSADIDRIEREVTAIGRSTPLPMAGVARALVSTPVSLHVDINDAAVNRLAAQLAAAVTYRPSDAAALIVNGQAFVIAEKSGSQLDTAKVAVAIRAAYGSKPVVSLTPAKLDAIITTASYETDLHTAQTMLGLSLQLKAKTAAYTPTPQQIGTWLSFNGPGKGVAVNGARVSAYVAGIPGKFDRVAATSALMGALSGQQVLSYALVTKTVTAAPALADTQPALPLVRYSYCLRSGGGEVSAALAGQVQSAVNAANGWGLSGQLQLAKTATACNLAFDFMSTADMPNVDPACAKAVSCLAGNRLVFNSDTYAVAPAAWTGTLAAYQSELVNHELGHWLGFDHSSCLGKAQPRPILEAPTAVLGGCSPNWYAIPVEVQGTKALNAL